MKRTPVSSGLRLKRSPLGLTKVRQSFGFPLFAILALVLACPRPATFRVVDSRVAPDLYFVQEIRPASSDPDEKSRLCHLVDLTLSAGFDYWKSEKSTQSPTLTAGEGERLFIQTFRMYKGAPPANDKSAFDARTIQKVVCRAKAQ
jgi:hypothetical protein